MASPRPRSRLTSSVLAIAASAVATSVAVTSAIVTSGCAVGPAGGESADGGPKDAAEAEQSVAAARARLKVAELEAQQDVRSARTEVAQAERELATAQNAIRKLVAETDLKVVNAQIEHDQAAHRADEAKAELAELQAMYDADEFALTTKELVLQRGRRSMEIAERRMTLQKQQLDHLRQVETPVERAKLEADAAAKAAALAKARGDLVVAQAKAELKLLEARHAVADAERKAK